MTALQPKVARLVNYVRGQNWIAPPVAFEPLLRILGREATTEEDPCACFYMLTIRILIMS